MDANPLLECFAFTLHPDASTRTQAEASLKEASATPGFLGACLDIISSNEVPEQIKLSASLYFKNKINYGWNQEQNGGNKNSPVYSVDNDEKPVIKDMLLQTMLQCAKQSPSCIRILNSALSTIIAYDYPEKKWESLLPQSMELLSSNNDIDSIHIGLLCLSEIFRTYRWKNNDDRQELEMLIMQSFPNLLEFTNTTLFQEGKNMNDAKFGELVKLVIKIYKFVVYTDLPFVLQRPESFIPWANFFVAIIQQDLPTELLNSTANDIDSRNRNPWVKCKKWAYANLYRLFQRYASRSLTRKFDYKDFKEMYLSQFLPQLLNLIFQQIERWGNRSLWLSDASIYYCLNFIEQCVCLLYTSRCV